MMLSRFKYGYCVSLQDEGLIKIEFYESPRDTACIKYSFVF